MGKAKIAPDVKRCIDIAWESTLHDSEANVKAADRQYRALLAVARAAQRQADVGNNWSKVLRALARLSRSSSPRAARARR